MTPGDGSPSYIGYTAHRCKKKKTLQKKNKKNVKKRKKVTKIKKKRL